MKLIQRGVDPRTPADKQIQNQMLLDGVWIGMFLMLLYFESFGTSTKLVKVIGAGIPLLLLVINFIGNKLIRKGRK
ncbi:MAG: hypothetical protein JWO47_1078 [Candidatus Saccharibacteria bacterium]|nr:hypothetical protein [Candidatus Saccharibacteria bacterium]